MTSDHESFWAAVGDRQLTPDALEHERSCLACANLRRALEELRPTTEAVVPPVPPDLVQQVRRELAAASPPPTAVPLSAQTPPLVPLEAGSRRPRRVGRVGVRVLAGLLAGSLVAGLLAVAAGVRSTEAPAYADAVLSDECTPALRQNKANHVVVAAVWAGEERRRFRLVLDRFEAESGIKVVFASRDPDADRDLSHTLRALSEGGCAPGVALLPQPGLLRGLSRDGKLLPVQSVVGNMVDENYMPVWRQLGKGHGDKLYGVWFRATNKSMIWYNARAYARAEVAPPDDWDGLKNVAETLKAKGITPFSVAADEKAGWTLTDWFENIYLQTAGPALYDQLARHEIAWNHPTVVTALDVMADILKPEWLAHGAADTTYEESVRQVFDNLDRPAAAMVFEADFVANQVSETGAKVGEDAKFFPFPSITGGMPTLVGPAEQVPRGEVGGDVAVLMQDRHEASALLRFLARPDAAVPWAKLGGFLSPNRNFPASEYPDQATEAAAKALSEATTVRFDLSDLQHPEFGSTPGRGMWRVLRDFVKDRQPSKATADRLEEAYCHTAPLARSATCRG